MSGSSEKKRDKNNGWEWSRRRLLNEGGISSHPRNLISPLYAFSSSFSTSASPLLPILVFCSLSLSLCHPPLDSLLCSLSLGSAIVHIGLAIIVTYSPLLWTITVLENHQRVHRVLYTHLYIQAVAVARHSQKLKLSPRASPLRLVGVVNQGRERGIRARREKHPAPIYTTTYIYQHLYIPSRSFHTRISRWYDACTNSMNIHSNRRIYMNLSLSLSLSLHLASQLGLYISKRQKTHREGPRSHYIAARRIYFIFNPAVFRPWREPLLYICILSSTLKGWRQRERHRNKHQGRRSHVTRLRCRVVVCTKTGLMTVTD